MGVISGTTEPAILVCDCYHLLTYVFLCFYVGQDPGWLIKACIALVIKGLSNLLMFILTFDQDFHFPVIQGLNLFYWKS